MATVCIDLCMHRFGCTDVPSSRVSLYRYVVWVFSSVWVVIYPPYVLIGSYSPMLDLFVQAWIVSHPPALVLFQYKLCEHMGFW